jgi:hypothetical protein
VSVLADTLPLMSNAAPWASTAGNKFREVTRSIDNPTTKLLAEGLMNRPSVSGDSVAWEGWSHVSEFVEEVSAGVA